MAITAKDVNINLVGSTNKRQLALIYGNKQVTRKQGTYSVCGILSRNPDQPINDGNRDRTAVPQHLLDRRKNHLLACTPPPVPGGPPSQPGLRVVREEDERHLGQPGGQAGEPAHLATDGQLPRLGRSVFGQDSL